MKIGRKLAQPKLPVVRRARTRTGQRPKLSAECLENRHLLATVYSDILDNDGSWSFTGTNIILWPDNNDLVPFSNEMVQAGNDFAWTHAAGSYELKKTFPGVTWQPGDYVFHVDVFARKGDSWLTGDVNVQNHGLTANGVHVTPIVHVRPAPQGTPWGWVTWSYQYSVGPADPIVGQAMGFDVDFSQNTAGELGFDNVRITTGSCSTTVTNTNDTGAGSLRDAIVCSNTTPGMDTIDFDLPGAAGPHTIKPFSPLPTVTDSVLIDGYTESGSSPNTNPPAAGSNANLQVILDGSMAGTGANGLTITSGGSTVRGLVINQFDGNGIQISGAGGNWLQGNFIGTDVSGSTGAGNGDNGIRIFGSSAGSNTIGTDGDGNGDAGEGNVISANGADAGSATRQNILIFQSNTQNVIAGNLIGTNAAGTAGLANGGVGIDISDGSDSARIGTNGDGMSDDIERNVISANVTAGIRLRGAPSVGGTVISGNLIGTDAAGTAAIGNTGIGVQLSRAVLTQIGTNGDGQNDAAERNIVSGNTLDGILISGPPQGVASPGENTVAGNHIGVDVTGVSALANGTNGIRIEADNLDNQIGGVGSECNTIAFNGLRGVQVGPTVSGVSILGNSTHSNGALGIDLNNDGVTLNDLGDADSGANGLQNFPVLMSATSGGGSTTISGTLHSTAGPNFTLEFFANATSDPSGFGEGETFIGSTPVTTDASGNASFVVTFLVSVPLGQTVTATATDAAGNTSEFSGNVIVTDTQVEFTAATYADGEGAGTSTVMTLERTDDSVVSEVQVSITGGTAQGDNVDYDDSSFPLNVTFNVGELTKQVPVPFVQENLVELDETIHFEVSPISGTTIGSRNSSTLTIQNDDAAEFSVSSESGFEDSGPITFTVNLSNAVDAATSVDVSTSDGTAFLTDSDYTQVSGLTLHFAAGETSQTFDVTPTADSKVELDETFSFVLSAVVDGGRDVTAGGCTACSTSLLGPSPYLSFADSPFSGLGLAPFHLEDFEDAELNTPGLSASTGVVKVPNAFVDSVDADDGAIDGLGAAHSYIVPQFGPTTLVFSFDDAAIGGFPTHAGLVWTDGSGPPDVTFEAFDAGGASLGTIGPVAVGDNTLTGETAEDRFFGVVHPSGISSIAITSNLGDYEVDHVQYGGIASLAGPAGTGTILNDDSAALQIGDVIQSETDGVTTFSFPVNLTAPVDTVVSATVDTGDGAAVESGSPPDDDYEAISAGTVTFVAGDTAKTIDVIVNGDNFAEIDETFFVDLAGLQANGRDVTFAVGGNQGLGTILNDDFAPIADPDGPYEIFEGQPLTLDASGSSDLDGDPITYRWDVDGDGDFDENITGVNPTVPWATLVSLGIDDGPDGPRTITVDASDGTNLDTASTTLTVDNDDPTADDDMGSVSEDGPAVMIDVLNNDSDPAGANDPLTVTGVNTAGTLGLVSFTGGDVTYDPNGQFESLDAGDSVTDSFQYSISDGDGGVATATVTVTIHGENDAPTVANPIDDVMANEDALDEIIDLSNVFDDVDAYDTLILSVTGNTNPSLLSAAIVGTDLILDYLVDQSGFSEITIRATDSAGLFVEDTFSVTVLSASDQIQDILTKVQAFQGVNTNGLESELNGALNKLAKNQDNAAANQLNAFINQINAFVNSGQITAQQVAECVASAQDAINSISEGDGST